MQIELTGCTNAGKSTLARHMLRAGREHGLDIYVGEEFVLTQFRLNWIKSRLLRKFLVNFITLLASLVTWRNNHQLYLFATQLLFQLPIPRRERLGLLRNVLKKIGLYEIVRVRRTGHQIILLDEGVLHVAHNLFVHVSAGPQDDAISTFFELIPKPDVVVYIRQPESQLIERTMKRGHTRIPDRSHDKVVRFVKQAVSISDTLAQHPAVENKVLIVDGQDVIRTATTHDDPAVDLALKIIRSGFTSDVLRTQSPTARASGLHDVRTLSSSLLEKGT